jgi:hypothetical protein
VFFWTPIELGGFGLTSAQIAGFLMLGGVSQAIWGLVVLPILHRRIGTVGILRACAIVWPISYSLLPIANVVLKKHLNTVFNVCAPIVIVLGSFCSMAFSKWLSSRVSIPPS